MGGKELYFEVAGGWVDVGRLDQAVLQELVYQDQAHLDYLDRPDLLDLLDWIRPYRVHKDLPVQVEQTVPFLDRQAHRVRLG